jgi:hypothetical protein
VLKTIDLHVEMYLKTGNPFHLKMADSLRCYVLQLKGWIHSEESRD